MGGLGANFYLAVVNYFVCALLIACSHLPSSQINTQPQTKELAETLVKLSSEVNKHEAHEISRKLIKTALSLSKEYDMMSPALYHNMLVNMGLRKRGLCCHWAEDLHAEVRELNTYSLKIAWLVARQGNHLREHNSIVIYANTSTWRQGIVFDPWRKAGIPFWTAVNGDEYPWSLHPLNGKWEVLRCK